MKFKSLKQSYPQKFCLKLVSRFLYYIGCGDCWYEERKRSNLEKFIYPFWAVFSNAYVVFFVLNECAAYFIVLSSKEKHDLLQHTIAHTTVYMKIIVLYLQRSRIKAMLRRFLEDTRSIFSSPELDKAAVKKGVSASLSLAIVTYGALFFFLMDGVKVHIQEGIPIRTEVTFFPRPYHSGIYINILRFFIEFHWWYLVAHMLLLDSLIICTMVFLEYKFKLLQLYFETLKNIFTENTEGKTQRELDEEFKNGLIVGIKLHEETLWCATNVQYAFGNIYSIQIVQSLTLFAISLIKLVISERSYILAAIAYIACMVVLTGAYMLVAGDITYEASMVPTSVLHCGWEYSHSHRDLRPLIIMAIQRSQVPVKMTAFGLVQLSHSNFISLLRSSYSFCAVML